MRLRRMGPGGAAMSARLTKFSKKERAAVAGAVVDRLGDEDSIRVLLGTMAETLGKAIPASNPTLARVRDAGVRRAKAASDLLSVARTFLATMRADGEDCTCFPNDVCPLCRCKAAIEIADGVSP